MRTLWVALSVLAIANLLAIGAFVGWLKMSDRLDADRLRSVRTMLSKTISDEKREKEKEEKKAEADKLAADEAAKKGRPPMTASESLAEFLRANEIDEQRIHAMRASIDVLRGPLQAEREAVTSARLRLEADKKSFEDAVAAHNERVGNEQFKKTVGVIDSLKPADARQVLMEVIRGADPAEAATRAANGDLRANEGAANAAPSATPALPGMKRALDYLNAMQARTRSKVMTEFVKDDPALASRLLEELRTYGQVTQGQGNRALDASRQ